MRLNMPPFKIAIVPVSVEYRKNERGALLMKLKLKIHVTPLHADAGRHVRGLIIDEHLRGGSSTN